MSEAWKFLADYLSNMPPRVPVMEDDGARDACNIEFQLKTLNLSHVNLDKCLGQRLCRSNMMIKNKKNEDCARAICSPNKVVIKKQTMIKMNLDLSLTACLFRHSFGQRLNDEEKRHEK